MKLSLIVALIMVSAIAILSAGKSSIAGATPGAAAKATATLASKSGSTVTGKATFTEKSDGVEIVVEVAGAKPGLHGVHLHATGDCSAADASSAGGHFNPGNTAHGAPNADPHHAGDFGNINVGANGKGTLRLLAKGLTVASGPNSVVGHALVVHADPDDLKTQPSGNSGARVACGAVTSM